MRDARPDAEVLERSAHADEYYWSHRNHVPMIKALEALDVTTVESIYWFTNAPALRQAEPGNSHILLILIPLSRLIVYVQRLPVEVTKSMILFAVKLRSSDMVSPTLAPCRYNFSKPCLCRRDTFYFIFLPVIILLFVRVLADILSMEKMKITNDQSNACSKVNTHQGNDRDESDMTEEGRSNNYRSRKEMEQIIYTFSIIFHSRALGIFNIYWWRLDGDLVDT
ncbi:hypothetical protein CHS0354_041118 [Potamilus streckersoni]|uniref:Uncharacterized protein n=1 Tax=Potamilus streckersoni TaxID=2493646 RepID=A0AAE0SDM8_9BIVA|nr:hypothetical protein CHS0354_041118 [Potamilus streckersoni]